MSVYADREREKKDIDVKYQSLNSHFGIEPVPFRVLWVFCGSDLFFVSFRVT